MKASHPNVECEDIGQRYYMMLLWLSGLMSGRWGSDHRSKRTGKIRTIYTANQRQGSNSKDDRY